MKAPMLNCVEHAAKFSLPYQRHNGATLIAVIKALYMYSNRSPSDLIENEQENSHILVHVCRLWPSRLRVIEG